MSLLTSWNCQGTSDPWLLSTSSQVVANQHFGQQQSGGNNRSQSPHTRTKRCRSSTKLRWWTPYCGIWIHSDPFGSGEIIPWADWAPSNCGSCADATCHATCKGLTAMCLGGDSFDSFEGVDGSDVCGFTELRGRLFELQMHTCILKDEEIHDVELQPQQPNSQNKLTFSYIIIPYHI